LNNSVLHSGVVGASEPSKNCARISSDIHPFANFVVFKSIFHASAQLVNNAILNGVFELVLNGPYISCSSHCAVIVRFSAGIFGGISLSHHIKV
jgi:hypothetical protein